ncbi:MAG: TVP38/TMEM64 family protein [Rhodobacteraceae bacterium]|nr:TVP38/TMEM64 family protein [Paracoccaceae bacterium]
MPGAQIDNPPSPARNAVRGIKGIMSGTDTQAHFEQSAGQQPAPVPRRSLWRRFLPLVVVVALMAIVFATGLHRYLSLTALAENREDLGAFVSQNAVLSVLAFACVYIVVVVLSVPGATILTVAGGLLFGGFWGGLIAVIAATVGATGVFFVARTAAGGALSRKAGPWLDRLAGGFREDAFSYLLFLRLVPVFPFWLVNLAPALLGVRPATYILATLIGIVPGTFTYSIVGAGLDSIIAAERAACAGVEPCDFELSLSVLVTPQTVAAFVALGLLALLPPVAKRVLARKSRAGDGA